MEGISVNVYKGLKGYWTKRGYQKLNRSSSRKQRSQLDLPNLETPTSSRRSTGQGRRRRRRFWRIKINPRIRIRLSSPKNWLKKLRDAYVKMMISFANSGAFNGGFGGAVEYGYAGYAGGFGGRPVKEYDEKMIVEIYKSLMMTQGQLVPPRGGGGGGGDQPTGKISNSNNSSSQIVCGR